MKQTSLKRGSCKNHMPKTHSASLPLVHLCTHTCLACSRREPARLPMRHHRTDTSSAWEPWPTAMLVSDAQRSVQLRSGAPAAGAGRTSRRSLTATTCAQPRRLCYPALHRWSS